MNISLHLSVGTRGHWNRSMTQNMLDLGSVQRDRTMKALTIMKAVIDVITVLKMSGKSVYISLIFENVNPIIYGVKYIIKHIYFIAINIYK